MEIPSNFQYKTVRPDMSNIIKFGNLKAMSELNCLKIATVVEFHPDDLTVTVNLLNKKTLGNNKDGTPNVRDYALIRAKVCFCSPYISYPIKPGDDCLVLFADREIESWFINGDAQPVNYTRMHDLTDAFAIFGIRSLPKMIDIMQDALHLNYSKVIAENFHAGNGASGTFVSKDNKTITVIDGIITNMTGGGGDPSITADEVIDALGYTPANTELSNLSSTGKTVIDGQWVHSYLDLVTSAITLNSSYSNAWDISSYLPNDNHIYEVYVSAYGITTATSGSTLDIRVGSSILKADDAAGTATAFVLRSVVRSSANRQVSNTIVVPIGTDRQLTVRSWGTGTLNILRLLAYRRIGTNS